MVAVFVIRIHRSDARAHRLLVKALQEPIYQLLRCRELKPKVEIIANTIACGDTECIFPHVILWIFALVATMCPAQVYPSYSSF